MKSDIVFPANFNREEQLLAARVQDCLTLCLRRQQPKFTGFLDLHQQKIAAFAAAAVSAQDSCFFGGFPEAERRVFGAFPAYFDEKEKNFPIVCIRAKHSRPLSHRDFLGALMSLGINREAVGDILVSDEQSFLFLTETIAQHVLDNLRKVGNVGVCLSLCEPQEAGTLQPRFSQEKAIVSSLRADCVTAALAQKSRAESAKLITGELVQLNHAPLKSVSTSVCSGDVLSIRRVGKFLIGDVETTTKKGRLVLSYKKYI